jgi:hypothetical protein
VGYLEAASEVEASWRGKKDLGASEDGTRDLAPLQPQTNSLVARIIKAGVNIVKRTDAERCLRFLLIYSVSHCFPRLVRSRFNRLEISSSLPMLG